MNSWIHIRLMNTLPVAQIPKPTTNKENISKLQSFYIQRIPSFSQWQFTGWEKVLDRGWLRYTKK